MCTSAKGIGFSGSINHFPGPLLLLPNFHHGLRRHCSLHNLNLGLAATANGSSLLLGQTHFIDLKGVCFKRSIIYSKVVAKASSRRFEFLRGCKCVDNESTAGSGLQGF